MYATDLGVAFITFDFRTGHVVPYYKNISDTLCDKMALKILMTGLAGDRSSDNLDSYYGSSMTPFSENQKIVFSYLFPIIEKESSEPRPSALTIVFPQAKQGALYRLAATISQLFQGISTRIQSDFSYGHELSSKIKKSLDTLLDYEFLEKSNILDVNYIESTLPAVDLKTRTIKLSLNEIIALKEFDIPELASDASMLLIGTSKLHKEVIDKFGDDFFKILKSINGKRTIRDISNQTGINHFTVSELLKILLSKNYISIRSDRIKCSIMHEIFYNSFYKTLKQILGNKGTKLFRDILEKSHHILIQTISYNDFNAISFETLNNYIELQEEYHEQDLIEILMSPITKAFDKLEKIHGTAFVQKLKNTKIKELEERFGKKSVEPVKLCLYQSDLVDAKNIVLQKNNISQYPDEIRLCYMFEVLYNSFFMSLRKILGDRVKIWFKQTLETDQNKMIQMINYSDILNISFDALSQYIGLQDKPDLTELTEILMTPIVRISKKAEVIYGSAFIDRLKKSKIKELEELFVDETSKKIALSLLNNPSKSTLSSKHIQSTRS